MVKLKVTARARSSSRPRASVSVSVRAWFRVCLGFPLGSWLGLGLVSELGLRLGLG